jgi:hypothetical protein
MTGWYLGALAVIARPPWLGIHIAVRTAGIADARDAASHGAAGAVT